MLSGDCCQSQILTTLYTVVSKGIASRSCLWTATRFCKNLLPNDVKAMTVAGVKFGLRYSWKVAGLPERGGGH